MEIRDASAEDAPAAGDHGVGRQDKGAGMALPHRLGLGAGQAQDMGSRQFARQRRLVDLGRVDAIGDDADLAQQFEAARRGGG